MRKLQIVASMLIMLSFHSLHAQKNFTLQPEKPRQKSTLTIHYTPLTSPPFGIEEFSGYAYTLHSTPNSVVQEITLTKTDNQYVAYFEIDDSARAVFFKFGKDDNDRAYYTLIYDNEGKPVPGAYLAAGKMLSFTSHQVGLKRDAQAGVELLKAGFESNPSDKEKYRDDYLTYLSVSTDPNAKIELNKVLDAMATNPNATERDLNLASYYNGSALKDKEKAAELQKKVKEKFPNGGWLRTGKISSFYKEKDVAKKDAIYREIVKQYPPGNEAEENQLQFMASDLANNHAEKKDYVKMNEILAMINDKNIRASAYNNIAWQMIGEGVNGKPSNIEVAKELSAKSLALVKERSEDMTKKPTYLTERQWKDQNNTTYYLYGDTYAVILYHNKEYDKAYEMEKKAVAAYKREDVGINTAYCAIIEKAKGSTAAREELENFVKEGKYSPEMKAQLKKIYLAEKHTEAQWQAFIASLEKESLAKKREELVKEMLNTPAPQFTLRDLNGNQVSLASLKGKTVVLDFWATWCGPCVASMPTMQKAVNKYKQDPNVVFLFIDTWEGGDNKAQREKDVKDFITKKNYSFTVLYDETKKDNTEQFIVVSDYKVEGIPTKFVIDKNSIIRFKKIGFNANADEALAEISMMIELASNDSKSGSGTEKKGF